MMSRFRKPSACAGRPVLDRRRYPRYTVQVPIEIQVEGHDEAFLAETSDLSRNGCYVRLQNPLPIARWVHAVLTLDGIVIQVEGRIVTRHPEFGNGIMFLKMPDREEKVLATYLEAVTVETPA